MKKARAATIEAMPQTDKPVIGSITVKKVVRETVPVTANEQGQSFGALIDDLIADAAVSGEEIQDVTVSITEEHWQEIAKGIKEAEAEAIRRNNDFGTSDYR